MPAHRPVLEHIHPGHPVTLAVDIMRRYPSYAAATARNPATTEPLAALRNAAIPGSAAHIVSALEMLDYALQGNVDVVLEVATEFWQSCAGTVSPADHARATGLAEEHASEFRERVAAWPRHDSA